MHPPSDAAAQDALSRLQAGDAAGLATLLDAACVRLGVLAHKMFHGLHSRAQLDLVLPNAAHRLCASLRHHLLQSPRDYYRLAAMSIRRELIDLSRQPFASAGAAHDLRVWGALHEQIEALPDEQRDVFDLVLYAGQTHAFAADRLGVCVKTIQRRWDTACVRLTRGLPAASPPDPAQDRTVRINRPA